MNTPASVTVKVDPDRDPSTSTLTVTAPAWSVCPAGTPVTVTVPHLDPDRDPSTLTGVVVRTWVTPARDGDPDRLPVKGDRWYEVNADSTGLTVTAPAVHVDPRPGVVVTVGVDGLGDCPVVFEVERKLPDGRWVHATADFSGATSYQQDALDDLAGRIARYYATVHAAPVRVSVQRPGNPNTYAYATANPPASAVWQDTPRGEPVLAA